MVLSTCPHTVFQNHLSIPFQYFLSPNLTGKQTWYFLLWNLHVVFCNSKRWDWCCSVQFNTIYLTWHFNLHNRFDTLNCFALKCLHYTKELKQNKEEVLATIPSKVCVKCIDRTVILLYSWQPILYRIISGKIHDENQNTVVEIYYGPWWKSTFASTSKACNNLWLVEDRIDRVLTHSFILLQWFFDFFFLLVPPPYFLKLYDYTNWMTWR